MFQIIFHDWVQQLSIVVWMRSVSLVSFLPKVSKVMVDRFGGLLTIQSQRFLFFLNELINVVKDNVKFWSDGDWQIFTIRLESRHVKRVIMKKIHSKTWMNYFFVVFESSSPWKQKKCTCLLCKLLKLVNGLQHFLWQPGPLKLSLLL